MMIGVSVPVPDPWGTQIQKFRVGLGDAEAAGILSHITLVPPVAIPPDQLPAVIAQLTSAAQSIPAFDVGLRGSGSFRPVSPVTFVELAQGAAECTALAHAVRQGSLAMESAFPYYPHVTLAQDVADSQLDHALDEFAAFEADFRVDRVALYTRDAVRGWMPIESLSLG